MAQTQMQKYLASMNQRWDESKQGHADMFGGDTIPAGIYVAQLRKAELCLSKSKGQLQIRRSFAIVDGEQKGRSVRDFMNLETEYGFIFARRFLDVLGFQQPESAEDLEGILAEVVKEMPVCKIEVKKSPSNNGGEFVNIQVNSRVDMEAGEAAESAEAPAAEETPAEEAPVNDENRDALYAFCVANSVVEGADGDSDDAEQLAERIKASVAEKGKFLKTELSEEEQELLTANDLADCMAEPEKPKVKPVARAAAAPAKKPAPAPASKTGLLKKRK